MPRTLFLLLTTLLAVAAPTLLRARPHPDPEPRPAARMALVVIEVPGCYYCQVFRREVRPAYEASPGARQTPLRFLDLEAAKARQLAFERPVDVLPTVVLFHGGREVSRISGYLPPETFVHLINHLLSRSGRAPWR